jgi:NADH dehydrogenase [ubiquinone] 1 alpha subcomplex assembly factor 1
MCHYLNPLNFYTLFVFSVFFSASAKPEKIMSYDDMEPLPLIFDFTEEDIDDKWIVVNDNVMGGRSEGGYSFRKNRLIFSGNTNTNGGGFSSIRTNPTNFYLGDRTGLHIRFKGDGRTYKLGVRIEGKSVSYRSNFTSGNGWQEVRVPFNEMDVSWRGRPLSKEEHPLIKSKIRSIEFMIYDKQDGPFKLQVDWIKSY